MSSDAVRKSGTSSSPNPKISNAIKNYNTAELICVDVLVDPRNMWAKVRRLTGRTKSIDNQSHQSQDYS